MLMRRSFSLNWYGMLNPIGPYFALSCTKLWKNASPNTILRHAASLVHVSKNEASLRGSDANVRANPAFKPFGASLVIFTEFSRMETGKIGLG